jgi:putative CocE/NonD family hydrolase
MKTIRTIGIAVILLIRIGLGPVPLKAQGLEFVKANYTKFDYRIPMRDGKKLFTSVYVPKSQAERWPILLERTPYGVGPYGKDAYREALGPSAKLARDRYIFVYQDVRGRNLSEGEFSDMRPESETRRNPHDVDESSDAYDSIEWLLKNIPNNNGRVGLWGISYPGFYAAAGLINAHPAVKCASPQAPVSNWFLGDDFHHNGALYLVHTFRFFNLFGRPRVEPGVQDSNAPANPNWPDAYPFFLQLGPLRNVNDQYFKNDVPFWNEIVKHPNYDEFWQMRNLPPHLRNVKPAVMSVGGWFDAEDLYGALNVYRSIETQDPRAVNTLVMGPWYHGAWAIGDGDGLGDISFASKTAEFYRDNIEFPFFSHYLKGRTNPQLPEAYVFETGRNEWHKEDTWPPKGARPASLYCHAGGKLSFNAPASEGFDEYVSDPSKPVPYTNGQSSGMKPEHMTGDQRFAATRPDVLVYQTDPLASDVTVAGPVIPSLFVSTTGTDSDFVVKLIDVFPDDAPDNDPNPAGVRMAGYEQLVRGEVMRGRFRKSYQNPQPFVPGEVDKVEYTMPDIYHTFQRGHRIMVQIQSSWFPLVDRNPQKFVDIYTAKDSDFQKATERVYCSRSSSSRVILNILPQKTIVEPAF